MTNDQRFSAWATQPAALENLQRARQLLEDEAFDVIALGKGIEVLEAHAALLRLLDLGDFALEVAQRGDAAGVHDLALAVDAAVQDKLQDDWRSNSGKTKLVRNAIRAVLEQAANASRTKGFSGIREGSTEYSVEAETTRILELVTSQYEY